METPKVTSLDHVLAEWMDANPDAVGAEDTALVNLRERLLAREDNMADVLRLAGAQFLMFPEIVAEVLAEVGLGTPIDDDQRMFIRRQFAARMEWWREQFGTQ